MKTASITMVINAVAAARRPPIQRSISSIIGHVATTIVVAQINALRNGSKVHRLPLISTAIIRMTSTVRVRSLWICVCMKGLP
jgi:hypothetical protein